jgi:hypothetical protein
MSVYTHADTFDVTLDPDGEYTGEGWDFGEAKCDECGKHTHGIEYWHRGGWVMFMCPDHAFSPWEGACARLAHKIESNYRAATLEIMGMSDAAAERYL